jgi:hypothetical protein
MPADPPVSFQQMAQRGGNPAAGGYPYQIKASDLDKNFVFATLDIEEGLIDSTTGSGGHPQRKLKIPAPDDSSVKHNLSATSNELDWTPAVPDGKTQGQAITWNAGEKSWRLFPLNAEAAKKGSFPQWTDEGWKAIGEGEAKGQFLKWNNELNQWVRFSGSNEGDFPQWHATNGWESKGHGAENWQLLRWNAEAKSWVPFTAPPSTGTHVLGAVDGELQWIATEEC